MLTTEEFIAKWEGCRLKSYADLAGYATVGYGHKIFIDKDKSLTITRQEAEAFLKQDIKCAENQLWLLLDLTKLMPTQKTALISFVFNLGIGNFKKSRLFEKIKAGDPSASEEFPKWCFYTVNGRRYKSQGLLNRRKCEREYWLEGVRLAKLN